MNIVMIHSGDVVLQNYMEILKVEPTSCTETHVTFFGDGNEATDVKIEEVTDLQEEDPLLVTLPVVPAEHEVSYIGLGVHYSDILQISNISCCMNHVHLSLPMKTLLL